MSGRGLRSTGETPISTTARKRTRRLLRPPRRANTAGAVPTTNGGYAHGTDYNDGLLAVDQIREIFRDFPALTPCGRRPESGASYAMLLTVLVALQIR